VYQAPTFHLKGAHLLSEARRLREGLGDSLGVFVVEGWDDKCLFQGCADVPGQVIAAGSKFILDEAFSLLEESDKGSILFLRDCDYDVPAGRIRPAPELLLTETPALECDLVLIGALDRVVVEIQSPVSGAKRDMGASSETILARAMPLAAALGRIRYVSECQDLRLSCNDLPNLHKYRTKGTTEVDTAKLALRIVDRSQAPRVDCPGLLKLIENLPEDLTVCHGHDLLACIGTVLRTDFKFGGLDRLPEMLRLAPSDRMLAGWRVVTRIAEWEQRTGRRILHPGLVAS
jgi:hypothetical protein